MNIVVLKWERVDIIKTKRELKERNSRNIFTDKIKKRERENFDKSEAGRK